MIATVKQSRATVERRPTLTMLGDIPLVTPWPVEELPLATRQRIDRAELRARAGLRAEASRTILQIEADLGVTPQDRIDAINLRGDYELAIDAALKLALASIDIAKVTQRKAKKGKTKAASAPRRAQRATLRTEEDLTEDQIARLAKATAKLASADQQVRDEGRDEIEEVERWHNRRIEGLRRDVEESERRELEALRDPDGLDQIVTEEIEVPEYRRDEDGFLELEKGRPVLDVVRKTRTRVTTRDGLDTLLTANAINTMQYDAGMRYRSLFENAGMDGRIKSIMAASTGKRRMALTEEEIFADENWMAEVARAKAHEPVANVEKYIRDRVQNDRGCSKTAERAVTAVRAIAGAGWTLYRLAPAGRKNQQYSAAINQALTLAADYFGMW